MPRWVPNALTALRIALVPAFLAHAAWCDAAVAAGETGATHRWLAAAALVAIGASDVADGWIARRWGLATPLGATLDAAADKLVQVSALVYFALPGGEAFARVPAWLVVLVLARDVLLAVGYVRIRRRRGRVEVVHEHHGRAATVLLFALVLWITLDGPRAVVVPASAVIAAVVVSSTLRYTAAGLRQWRAAAP